MPTSTIYDLTPNLGLKNIKIGEIPWGNEERENKNIIDSAYATLANSGTLSVNLPLKNRLSENPTSVQDITINGVPAVNITPISSSLYWVLPPSATEMYSNTVRPFIGKGLVSTTVGVPSILGSFDTNFLQDVFATDEIVVGANRYTVSDISSDTLMSISSPALATLTGVNYTVVPRVNARLTVILTYIPNTILQSSFSISLKVLDDISNIDFSMPPALSTKSMSIGSFITESFEIPIKYNSITPGLPALLCLNFNSCKISLLNIDITFGKVHAQPTFVNTYYNITPSELEAQSTDYEYDSSNNIIKATENIFGQIRISEYEYNLNGDIVKQTITFEGVRVIESFEYDSNGNILRVSSDRTPTYAPNVISFVTI